MNTSTKPPSSQEAKEQAYKAWQAQHAAKRKAKGYDKPVSDEQALAILG